MQAITRRLGQQYLRPTASISSIKSIYPLSYHYYGGDHPRYGSTLAFHKGTGHLIRKGTGGRSSISGIIATFLDLLDSLVVILCNSLVIIIDLIDHHSTQ
ncbi:NADH dehydrogenase [ubiquinone] 1 alpha subcomplex subunit 9, mitochondrial-like [Hibiscus syriacus]|uniref:NADH dehydrogenase [ubiquinone] 1 alpha subcomplex subunit 9, mitochondrial-like n=1 Tax=Hibiscus syriacus TaxID=106335 RepID=UPI0019209EFE|nr:NADH dehydrogenase [ubiquinone] 1 alpha subcomplex subunit 9, mitochondrial-like [Hibiscus syriacus]